MASGFELWEQGDQNGALEFMDKAIEMVPFEDHPAFAALWFDRANWLEDMGRYDEAEDSRETGFAWERGE